MVTEKVTLMFQTILEKTNQQLDMVNEKLKRVKTNTDAFARVIQKSNSQFKTMVQTGEGFNTMGARFARRVRMMTVGLHGFRMEMLSVMFFGMMMANMFKSMLQPAAEVFGFFELWQTLLMITFIPIMEELFPLFLQMFEFFANLPEPVQKAIGVFVILGMIFGNILFFIGQMTLGIGGLITAFPGLIGGIAKVAGSIAAFLGGISLGSILVIGAIIAALVFGLVAAWKENFLNIRQSVAQVWQGIKQMFMGGINFTIGLFKMLWGILTLDSGLWLEGFKQMWSGIKSLAIGIFNFIVGLAKTIGTIIVKVFTSVLDFMGDIISSAWSKLKGLWNKAKGLVGFGGDNPGENMRSFNDVILRPGQPPIQVSRNDTIVAAKSGLEGGAGGESINFAPVFNINVTDKAAMEREMARASQKMIDDLRRVLKVDIR